MNEEAKVIYDAGLADGRRLGVQDKVSQDHARWRAVFGLVMTELHAIVRGEHHTCTPDGPVGTHHRNRRAMSAVSSARLLHRLLALLSLFGCSRT